VTLEVIGIQRRYSVFEILVYIHKTLHCRELYSLQKVRQRNDQVTCYIL